MSFNGPFNAHGSNQSGVACKSRVSKPSSTPAHATPPGSRSSSSCGKRGKETNTNGHKSTAVENAGDSVVGSETKELEAEANHLQLLIAKQLTQHQRAAVAGLGKV